MNDNRSFVESLGADDSGSSLKKVWTNILWRAELKPETDVLIEEFGDGRDYLALNFYKILGECDGRKGRLIGTYESEEFPNVGGRKFLEESLDPVEVHDHGFGIEHRVWEISGMEAKALVDLTSSGLGPAYEESGWRGFRDALKRLKEALESPFENKETLIQLLPYKVARSFDRLSKQVEQHAKDKKLGVREAAMFLALKNERFATNYRKVRSKPPRIVKRLEEVFDPYCPDGVKSSVENPSQTDRGR